MRRVIVRVALASLALAALLGASAMVADARREAAARSRVAQLVTQFGTDTLAEEVVAERLLRASTPARQRALSSARRAANARLQRARTIRDAPALGRLTVLHARYQLAVDAEQAQTDRDFALRSAIHDRQVIPAFSALRTETDAQVRALGRSADTAQTRADAFSAAAIALALLLAGAMTARLVRQRARLVQAEQHARHEDERRRLTEASEARVRQIVEQIADALVIVELSGEVFDVNPAAERVYGRSREELLTLRIFDLSAMDAATFEASVDAVREHGTVRVEGTHRRRDGTAFPIEATLSRYVIDDRPMILGAIRDISERRAIEAEARRSAAVLAQLDAAVIAVDADGVITTFNPAAEDLFERERDAVIGRPVAGLRFFDDAAPSDEASAAPELDAIAVGADGRRTPVVVATTEIAGSDALPAGAVIVAVDVTDQRRIAAELERRVRQQASVVQLGQLAIEGAERDALFGSAAEALRSTLGIEHAAVLERLPDGTFRAYGQGTAVVVPSGGLADHGLGHPEGLLVDARDGAAYHGDPLWAADTQAALVAVIPGDGDGFGVLAAQSHEAAFTDEDLSYLRAVAHVLGAAIRRETGLDLERQLEQSTRLESLGMLAGGVAHDFNNLLSVIMSFVQFAIDEDGDRERRREDLTEALSAARRAAELTGQLLAFSRVGRGDPEPIDVNAAVDQTQAMLRRTLGENVVLMSDLDRSIGAITLVPGQLEQVLVNLAVNARDAMPGGGRLTIATRNVEHGRGIGRAVELRVTDTGSGMPDDVRAKAFDPFFSTKLPGAGTGLGLATVHGIVSRAGGTAEILSTEPTGTTFVLRFPATGEVAPRRDAPADAHPGGEGELVMVVEDEPQVLALTARILRMHGYRVTEVDSPERALALHGELRPAVLLTDVMMPGLSGAELAERLLQADPDLRVIFMTGYAGSTDLGRFGDGTVVVQKPFSATELLTALTADSGDGPVPSSP